MKPEHQPKKRPFFTIKRLKIIRKHPATFYLFSLLGMLLLAAVIFHFVSNTSTLRVTPNSKIVIVSHDGVQQIVPSDDKTVGDLLNRLHININKGDVVEPNLATVIDQDEFRINIYRAVPVAIILNNNITYTYSAATTPRAIAEQSGATVYPQDYVSTIPSENFLEDGVIGERVVIDPATPINVNLYGTALVLRTHADTVAGLISQNNIHLAASDQVTPALNSPLTQNTVVTIERKGTQVQTVTQSIPMPIQVIDDNSLAYGTSAIRQAGSNGTEVVTYQDNLVNGIVVSKTVLQTVITTPPVTEIVAEGTSLSGIKGDMALAGIAPGDYQYADYIISNESGWCPTKAQGQYGGCPPYAGYVPDYGGYGLCQSTPGDKMASAGADWATNPITQLKWCSGYAQRYGGWYGSYVHWMNYHSW